MLLPQAVDNVLGKPRHPEHHWSAPLSLTKYCWTIDVRDSFGFFSEDETPDGDALRCRRFGHAHHTSLPIDFRVQLCDETFAFAIRIRKIGNEQTTAGHKSKKTAAAGTIEGHR